jgi:hypothetical protein
VLRTETEMPGGILKTSVNDAMCGRQPSTGIHAFSVNKKQRWQQEIQFPFLLS